MKSDWVHNLWRYLLVLVIAMAAIILTLILTDPKDDPSAPGSTDPTGFDLPEVSKSDADAINQLIKQYFSAKRDADADLLNTIVETWTPFKAASLAEEAQYISEYSDIYTYATPTNSEEFYITYVTYKIYFNGIQEGAPSLNRFVIRKESKGDTNSYYIYNKELDPTLSDFIDRTEELATVVNLKKAVEKELKEACDRNADLNSLIRFLEEGITPSRSESETADSSSSNSSENTGSTTEDAHN